MNAATPIGAENADQGDCVSLFIVLYKDERRCVTLGGSSQNRTENLTRMKLVSRRGVRSNL